MNTTVKLVKLDDRATLPTYATDGSVGADLYACLPGNMFKRVIDPHQYGVIGTGIAIALPPGFEAQVRPRSGLAAKNGITVLNAPGTIDSDFRGEIAVILINHGEMPFLIQSGMRIAQLVISNSVVQARFEDVDKLDDTARGSGGFGHTGT